MARKPICPTPPSPSLVAVPGGGFGLALPHLPCRGGGGGPTPTYMAQNDPHVALIILTTHLWGKFFCEKKFSGPKFVFNLCSSAFGGNIRPYTKQRARHGSPFLEPPPSPAKQFSGRHGFGLPMAEDHIKTNSTGLQCVEQCCYEQNAQSQT